MQHETASLRMIQGSRKSCCGDSKTDTISRLLQWGGRSLKVLGAQESQLDAERLLEEVSGLERSSLYLNRSQSVPKDVGERYRRLITLRKGRVPLAYLIGKAYFWNEVLEVGPGCFVPRPETETLVERLQEELKRRDQEFFSFLDLGTGTGAIGIALLRIFPEARATLVDLSETALEFARGNVSRYQLCERAVVVCSNLFERFRLEGDRRMWDVIICNPPYFSAADWKEVAPEIFSEPREALDGGADGFDFYRRIIGECGEFLKPGGLLVFEIGWKQAKGLCRELDQKGFFQGIQVFKDHGGTDRVVMARLRSL
jgi:release factor glutamine methyltransferase